MAETQSSILVGGVVIVGMLLMGMLVIFGLFGLWRRHNLQNSAASTPTNPDAAKVDPWITAGQRLKVDDEDPPKQ